MDDYSDDGFDELNQDTLQELENNAIVQFTQAQTQAQIRTQASAQGKAQESTRDKAQINARPPVQPQGPGSFDVFEIEDDDLDDSELINGLLPPAPHAPGKSKPPAPPPPPPPAAPPAHPQRSQLSRPLAERAPPAYRPSSQQQQWNARPGLPPASPYARPPPTSSRILPTASSTANRPPSRPQHGQFIRPTPTATAYQASQGPRIPPSSAGAGVGNDIVAALQQRVRALESELYTAKGEIAIIRSNSTKAQQEHAAELGRLQKLNAEQQAKNQRLIDQALAAEKNATTELQFLQRDLQEASTRARRKDQAAAVAKQTGAASTTARAGTATTPGKTNKTWSVADGFDDMDMVVSPSKGRARTRDVGAVAIPPAERTPSKGKRKRPTLESPVMPLETHEADVLMADDGDPAVSSPASNTAIVSNTLPFEVGLSRFPIRSPQLWHYSY